MKSKISYKMGKYILEVKAENEAEESLMCAFMDNDREIKIGGVEGTGKGVQKIVLRHKERQEVGHK